ncbi:alpha/beta hydrolase [Mycolicibacterium sp.]|uniref:alpha/beta fold hydrolase n=1 Tax=Mycolicibacterium sp. TaxID=2320850 RepID=UPI001A31BBB0|nr:alpha/beta hydrolase [Mycolicibacterium sp.]MBJ7337347.1 alpha/beta hydrolase [Mycolicibacterium sp.]
MTFRREPIHVGSGEPILLLHPFLCSQEVWSTVAEQLAETGRFEVFAPTMVGHHGGPRASSWFLDTHVFADEIERQLDQLGWRTAHIVGNSLGGWVSFELERRGRARTVTAIAPAGGWKRYSPVKFEVVGKFILGGPVLLAARLFGPRILQLPFARRIATLAVSGPADGPREPELLTLIDDATHCPAYLQMLIKSLTAPGLDALADSTAPVQLVTCEFDRVVPHPRFSRHFTDNLPATSRVSRLEGVGHIPMLEAPGRVTELIADFVDEHTEPMRQAPPAG